MHWIDRWTERSTRAVARRVSRRSVLSQLASWLVGAGALPLLPIARGAEPARPAGAPGGATPSDQDPLSCDYWRNCGVDGFLCGCCGGSPTQCPPGTEMSAVTWIGTCHNPADGRDYVISYNDCCGKSPCGRCFCNRNEGDSPLYQPGRANDYDWCSASTQANIPYHCTTTRIVGLAE
jgi:methylamine dehydrogenase light chain